MTSVATFKSSSSDKVYTVRREAGALSCDCPAWRFKRGDKPRTCKHVSQVGAAEAAEPVAFLVKATPVIASLANEALGFISPMLASPLPEGFAPAPGEWAAEEKYDGHRVVVRVGEDGEVTAWSRTGKPRRVTDRVRAALKGFPACTLDTEEVVPGGWSKDVKRRDKAGAVELVVFDLLRLVALDASVLAYLSRRELLVQLFHVVGPCDGVRLAQSWPVSSTEDVSRALAVVFRRGGEGLILKRLRAPYHVGARRPDWIKLKRKAHAVVTVTGFEAGELGPWSVVVGVDADGDVAKVKTLNNKERREFALSAPPESVRGQVPHPAIGRRLVVEYQFKEDGAYRHPMWDRWAEEGE